MRAGYEQRWIARGTDWLGVQWYPAPADPAAPVVLLWPAMGVPAGYYRPFVAALQAAGLAVVATDLRGTGTSTPPAGRRSRYGYADLAEDVGEVCAAVARECAGRQLLLVGHSLGGQACLLHLAAGAATADGLALVGVGMPYWRAYPRWRWGVLGFTQGLAATAAVLRVWPGWGFGGRQARGVIRDWAFTARTGRFPALPGVAADGSLPGVKLPVLAVSLARDRHVPPSVVDHLVAHLPGAAVRRVRLDGDADHFRWARSGGPVVDEIAGFARQLPG